MMILVGAASSIAVLLFIFGIRESKVEQLEQEIMKLRAQYNQPATTDTTEEEYIIA
jgi:hypothetical protein